MAEFEKPRREREEGELSLAPAIFTSARDHANVAVTTANTEHSLRHVTAMIYLIARIRRPDHRDS